MTAVTLTAGSAPPALAAVTSALTGTLSQSYHVVQQDTEYLHRERPGQDLSLHVQRRGRPGPATASDVLL